MRSTGSGEPSEPEQIRLSGLGSGEETIMSYKDPEAKREYMRKYRQTHKEERAAYNRDWRAANKERTAEYKRQWRKKNPDLWRKSRLRWKRGYAERTGCYCYPKRDWQDWEIALVMEHTIPDRELSSLLERSVIAIQGKRSRTKEQLEA